MDTTQQQEASHEWDLPEPLFLLFEHVLTGCCYLALLDFSGGAKP